MSILDKKHTLRHIILGIVVIIVVLLLLLLPLNLPARTPLMIIQHDNTAQQNAANRSLNKESRDISAAKRRVDNARRNVERARQDLANAYIPRSEFQSGSRNYNIQQAESALNRAQIDYRTADNDLYLLQRLHESDEREQALESQRKLHRPVPPISESPYQQYNEDD